LHHKNKDSPRSKANLDVLFTHRPYLETLAISTQEPPFLSIHASAPQFSTPQEDPSLPLYIQINSCWIKELL
jgi:hypothetical protein